LPDETTAADWPPTGALPLWPVITVSPLIGRHTAMSG